MICPNGPLSHDIVDDYPRDALLRYRWTDGLGLSRLEIYYVSRGSTNDTAVVSGSEVTEIGGGSFSLGDTIIPFHRVLRIRDGETLVFERRKAG